jgi:hypothetical protein
MILVSDPIKLVIPVEKTLCHHWFKLLFKYYQYIWIIQTINVINYSMEYFLKHKLRYHHFI